MCNKYTVEVGRLRTLALETLNDLNPAFMNNIFAKRVSKKRKNFLEIPSRNTVKYRDKSIRSLGPRIWNGLPEEIKIEHSYDKFKEYLKTWYELQCTCSLCWFTELNTQIENKMFSLKYSLMITVLLELLPSILIRLMYQTVYDFFFFFHFLIFDSVMQKF